MLRASRNFPDFWFGAFLKFLSIDAWFFTTKLMWFLEQKLGQQESGTEGQHLPTFISAENLHVTEIVVMKTRPLQQKTEHGFLRPHKSTTWHASHAAMHLSRIRGMPKLWSTLLIRTHRTPDPNSTLTSRNHLKKSCFGIYQSSRGMCDYTLHQTEGDLSDQWEHPQWARQGAASTGASSVLSLSPRKTSPGLYHSPR